MSSLLDSSIGEMSTHINTPHDHTCSIINNVFQVSVLKCRSVLPDLVGVETLPGFPRLVKEGVDAARGRFRSETAEIRSHQFFIIDLPLVLLAFIVSGAIVQ